MNFKNIHISVSKLSLQWPSSSICRWTFNYSLLLFARTLTLCRMGTNTQKNDCWRSLPMWLMGLPLILSVYAQANTVRCQLGPVKLSMQENLIHVYHCMNATMYRSMLLLLFLLQLPKGKAETWMALAVAKSKQQSPSHQSTMADCFICLLKWGLVLEVKSLPFLPAWGICLEIPITEQDCLPFVCSTDGRHRALGLHENESPLRACKGLWLIFMPQSFSLQG